MVLSGTLHSIREIGKSTSLMIVLIVTLYIVSDCVTSIALQLIWAFAIMKYGLLLSVL